jgi:hypothetical protein
LADAFAALALAEAISIARFSCFFTRILARQAAVAIFLSSAAFAFASLTVF